VVYFLASIGICRKTVSVGAKTRDKLCKIMFQIVFSEHFVCLTRDKFCRIMYKSVFQSSIQTRNLF
jgi:hypothetical protein